MSEVKYLGLTANKLARIASDLDAENTRLRERIDAAHMSRLLTENENESLRELCKAWRKFAYELFDDYIGEPEASDDFMELDDRMRELGIEV